MHITKEIQANIPSFDHPAGPSWYTSLGLDTPFLKHW